MPSEEFSQLLIRRAFVLPTAEIHGGTAGLFDLGPPACGVKKNILDLWNRHFVVHDGMLEIECPALTPERVLIASGHVAKFSDLMVKDEMTGECFRGDQLLEDVIASRIAAADASDAKPEAKLTPERKQQLLNISAQAEAFSPEQLGAELKALNALVSPTTGNPLSMPYEYNLMFSTSIGPTGLYKGYLRPETAQGIFVNFKRMLDYNAGSVPFAVAQVGSAFRNEIAPRNGLLRVREFTLAEIEHFMDDDHSEHPGYESVQDVVMSLYPSENQLGDHQTVSMTVAQAVEAGHFGQQTLAYYIARVQQFLEAVGIDAARLRFRQHLPTQLAHYARDCWDAEIHCSYGWVECVGIADRACYDLAAHAKATGTDLSARRRFDEPKLVTYRVLAAEKKFIAKTFKKDTPKVVEAIAAVEDIDSLLAQLELGPAEVGGYAITKEMVSVKEGSKNVTDEPFVPSVVEPSFGIGRILYCLLEHVYTMREGRTVMGFSPAIAPVKVSVLPLFHKHEGMGAAAREVAASLNEAGISFKTDTSSATIGKRYARLDEVGVPFAITVDHQTCEDRTVTLRDRDSMAQIRLPMAEVAEVLFRLCSHRVEFAELAAAHAA
jgi:glycyl-tRNA synthetase